MNRWKAATFLFVMTLAGVASGRRVTDSGNVHARKERRLAEGQLFWVMPTSNKTVQMLGYLAPAVGGRYIVADERGYVGEVRVASPAEDYAPCSGFFQANASYTDGPRRDADSTQFAFGPTERHYDRIHTIAPGDTGGNLPHPRESLMIAVDLDGDASADVAVFAYNCSAGPGTRGVGGSSEPICLESWMRDRESWKLTQSGKATCN